MLNVQEGWGIYNCGQLIGVEPKAYQARQACEAISGEPWKKCRKYYVVCKVSVTPTPQKRAIAQQEGE